MTPAQIQAQQAAQIQASERARLRSRKPADKNLPEGVEDIIIGDGAQRYRDLRDIERRLDSTMTRKRLDINDSVNRNVKVDSSLPNSVSFSNPYSVSEPSASGSPILLKINHGKSTLSKLIPLISVQI